MTGMDNPNLEDKLQIGITAAKRGDHEGARVLFKQVLAEDQQNERAWVWMAYVAEDADRRRKYLERILAINPNNKAARKAMQQLSQSRNIREKRTLAFGIVLVLAILVIAAVLCLIALAA